MTEIQIISLCLSFVTLASAVVSCIVASKAEKELDKAIKTQIEIWKMTAGRD